MNPDTQALLDAVTFVASGRHPHLEKRDAAVLAAAYAITHGEPGPVMPNAVATALDRSVGAIRDDLARLAEHTDWLDVGATIDAGRAVKVYATTRSLEDAPRDLTFPNANDPIAVPQPAEFVGGHDV